MQNDYFWFFRAKSGSEKKSFIIWKTAKNDKRASNFLEEFIEDNEIDTKNEYFKPRRTNFPVVNDLPDEGVIDEVWCTRYELADDKLTWLQITGVNQQEAQPAVELSESDQPSHSQEPRAYFAKMSQDTRGVAVLMHGFDVIDTVLTKGQMREVITISLDKENHYYSTMLDALRLPAVSIKGPEQFSAFVAGVGRRFEPGDKDVTLVNVRNYVEQLLAGNEFTSTDALEPQEISYETLSMHTMLSIMNVHPSEAKPSDVRNAKEMMEQRDPIWRGLDKTFRVIVGIRNVDVNTRHAIISEGLKNLKMLNDDSERLHFVKSYLAGHPACPELADYGQDATEVDNEENESERLAWICNITQKALLGETDVMSKSDIAELMVSVGEDLSPKYMSRFLSKEIDVCDPFKQLTEEDIPHLICDVLENWCNEKESRIAFINERVEFYLKDTRNAVSVLFENSKLAEVDGSVSTDLPNDADLSTEQAVSEVVNPGTETATEVTTMDVATTAPTEPVVSIPEIIEPGIYYDISNSIYHAGPGVSKSQLDDIAISPAIYLWRSKAPVDSEKLKALDMGTAVHCLFLESEEFSNRFIIAPEFNRRTNAGKEEEKEFLESCANTGKIVMDAEQGRKLNLMYDSAMAHPGARFLLEADGHCESAIYWNDQETGELCRIRPDKFLTTRPLIVDVKKVADMSRFARHVEEFRYHVQAAMYSDGFKAHFGEVPRFAFLAVSETIDCGRYPVRLFLPDDDWFDDGYQLFRRDLTTYHQCRISNNWGLGFEVIQRPYWARSRHE